MGICKIYAKRKMSARIVMYPFCTFVPFTSIAHFMNGKCKLQPSVYMRAEGTFACKKKVTVKHV